MSGVLEEIKIEIVGACGRGGNFLGVCQAIDGVRVQAICDTKEEELLERQKKFGVEEAYTDYEEMLAQSELDAVIVGTPMHLHVPQSILALRKGLHVYSEVPAGVSIEECQDLVRACDESDALYMMGENMNFSPVIALVRELVLKGLFGTVYYAEAESLHDAKELGESTPWRLRWQLGTNGINYGPHSLGPVLQWFIGDRVAEVCCRGSGHHYLDPRGNEYGMEDSCVMLCKMEKGGLVEIRQDFISERPGHSAFQLQGTDGCFESARSRGEQVNRIWLRSRRPDEHSFEDLEELEEEFLPEIYRKFGKGAEKASPDFFTLLDFIEAIQGKHPCSVGIHEAMDMTLPGLVSQQSIQQGGAWLEVPDSREWV